MLYLKIKNSFVTSIVTKKKSFIKKILHKKSLFIIKRFPIFHNNEVLESITFLKLPLLQIYTKNTLNNIILVKHKERVLVKKELKYLFKSYIDRVEKIENRFVIQNKDIKEVKRDLEIKDRFVLTTLEKEIVKDKVKYITRDREKLLKDKSIIIQKDKLLENRFIVIDNIIIDKKIEKEKSKLILENTLIKNKILVKKEPKYLLKNTINRVEKIENRFIIQNKNIIEKEVKRDLEIKDRFVLTTLEKEIVKEKSKLILENTLIKNKILVKKEPKYLLKNTINRVEKIENRFIIQNKNIIEKEVKRDLEIKDRFVLTTLEKGIVKYKIKYISKDREKLLKNKSIIILKEKLLEDRFIVVDNIIIDKNKAKSILENTLIKNKILVKKELKYLLKNTINRVEKIENRFIIQNRDIKEVKRDLEIKNKFILTTLKKEITKDKFISIQKEKLLENRFIVIDNIIIDKKIEKEKSKLILENTLIKDKILVKKEPKYLLKSSIDKVEKIENRFIIQNRDTKEIKRDLEIKDKSIIIEKEKFLEDRIFIKKESKYSIEKINRRVGFSRPIIKDRIFVEDKEIIENKISKKNNKYIFINKTLIKNKKNTLQYIKNRIKYKYKPQEPKEIIKDKIVLLDIVKNRVSKDIDTNIKSINNFSGNRYIKLPKVSKKESPFNYKEDNKSTYKDKEIIVSDRNSISSSNNKKENINREVIIKNIEKELKVVEEKIIEKHNYHYIDFEKKMDILAIKIFNDLKDELDMEFRRL